MLEVLGITDHHFVKSIYFLDPSGFRLELTAKTEPAGYMEEKRRSARAEIDSWTAEKAAWRMAPASAA